MINKSYIIIGISSVAILAGVTSGFVYFSYRPVGKITCTQEVKFCPDGSYVGRTGSN